MNVGNMLNLNISFSEKNKKEVELLEWAVKESGEVKKHIERIKEYY